MRTPRKTDLETRLRGIKASMLLAGIDTGKNVVLAPKELGDDQKPLYKTLVIPTDVDTYYYAVPLTHEPMFRTTDCRICETRVVIQKMRWIFSRQTGESVPICDDCYIKGGY